MIAQHKILEKLFMDSQFRWLDVTVWYADRQAVGDTARVSGKDIINIGAEYMEVHTQWGNNSIPYSRVIRIAYENKLVWEYGAKAKSKAQEKKG